MADINNTPNINFNKLYHIKNSGVFYMDSKIPYAESKSFVILGIYSKDKTHVYFENSVVRGASPDDFDIFDNNWRDYARSSKHVFYRNGILKGADPDSFEKLSEYYYRDKSNVYCLGKILDVDRNSFEFLMHDYSCDKNNGYFANKKIPESDGKSFKAFDWYFAKDTNHIYFRGQAIKDSNGKKAEDVREGIIKDDKFYYIAEDERCTLIKIKLDDPKLEIILKNH